MPVEHWDGATKKYGWACVEPGCFECGSSKDTKAEALQDFDHHKHECHREAAE
jgi:hypothetical protein